MGRNDQSDAGRNGAPSQTKDKSGTQLSPSDNRGDWAPAYGGGMGQKTDLDALASEEDSEH